MKVRIQANTIRLRLKKTEVQNFKISGNITEVIMLGKTADEQLRFILRVTDHERITLQYHCNTTTIGVPQQVVEKWADGNEVGFNAEIQVGDEITLSLLVEKDFKCLDGNEENDMDAYPNPRENCNDVS